MPLVDRSWFQRLCRARELLCEEREQPLTIEQVAREVAASRFHLIRRFEALFGMTPHQYRLRRRLDQAKLLLAAGRLSVTEVCVELGFSSLGSFSALFKRRVGVSPSAYRRRMRALAPAPDKVPPQAIPGCLSLMAGAPRGDRRNFGEAPPAPSPHAGRVPSTTAR
jgi:AraC-like DNA-binding protein